MKTSDLNSKTGMGGIRVFLPLALCLLAFLPACTNPIVIPAGPIAPTATPVNSSTPTPSSPTATNQVTLTATATGTPTNTPTQTYTLTATSSATSTPTVSATTTTTACATSSQVFGEPGSAGSGLVTVGNIGTANGTIYQQYSLSQLAELFSLSMYVNTASAGASIWMGIYGDSGNSPSNLIYVTPAQAASAGYNNLFVPTGVILTAGKYWLALGATGNVLAGAAASSTALTTETTTVMPNPASGVPVPASTGEAFLSGLVFTCNFSGMTPTPLITSTPTVSLTDTSTSTNTPFPTETPNNTPLITPTLPPTPPSGIYWSPCEVDRMIDTYSGGSTVVQALFWMSVNHTAENTDAVTLVTPSGPVPYAYVNSPFAGYALYSPTTSIVYTPGGTYTMTTITSAGTASATVTAPGGNVTLSPDGLFATWDVQGNESYLSVHGSGGFTYKSWLTTSNITSPFPISSSAYPTSGTYTVYVDPQNVTYSVTGATAGSYFEISDQLTTSTTR